MKHGTLLERFEYKVSPEPMSGCWLWLGKAFGSWHGQIRLAGRWVGAHRVAWMLFRGDIPGGLCVCHKCDVPTCVNPAHLFLGTAADNAADRDKKGRNVNLRGESHGNAKLTEEAVRLIRASIETQWTLARRYGVWQSVISAIRLRRTWRHVE
jgi:hypothetical protein